METCPFVGENSMKEYKVTGETNLIMGYRINAFNNILFSYSPLFDDSVVWSDDRVWKCDNDCKDDAINACKNLSAQSAKEGSTVKGIYCYQGTAYDFEQPNNSSTSSSLLNNLYCTKSCMVCNELRGYYGNESKCIALNDGRNCEHTETHNDFAADNEVCYYMNGTCSKFTNDYYTFGDEDLSCDSGAQTALDPKNRHVYSGGHTQECHYCRCTFSNVNVNTCNWLSCNADVFNRAGDNLETCINMGYTIEKVNLTTAAYSIDEYLCMACPFDANWWKCLPRIR
jgi:hypothetical protein